MKFTKHQRTNILPLRWFGNICEYLGHHCLTRYLYWEDLEVENSRSRFWAKASVNLYKPYTKWGTYYRIQR